MTWKWVRVAALILIGALTTVFLVPRLSHSTWRQSWLIMRGMSQQQVEAILGPAACPAHWTEYGKFIGLQSRWREGNAVIVVTYNKDLQVMGSDWLLLPEEGEPFVFLGNMLYVLGIKDWPKIRE